MGICWIYCREWLLNLLETDWAFQCNLFLFFAVLPVIVRPNPNTLSNPNDEIERYQMFVVQAQVPFVVIVWLIRCYDIVDMAVTLFLRCYANNLGPPLRPLLIAYCSSRAS